jgi:hypothetical protein
MLASMILSGGIALFATVPAVHAQSTGVSLSCGTNYCQASASSPGSPTPFRYNWSFSGIAHLTAPFACDKDGLLGHRPTCMFHCYQPYQDHIIMHVTAVDATGAYIGEASAGALCNGSIGDQ